MHNMTDKPCPLPQADHVRASYLAMRPALKFFAWFSPSVRAKLESFEAQLENVDKMVEERSAFTARFGPCGWTNYNRLGLEIVRAALAESDEAADQHLIAYHLDPEELKRLGYRFNARRYEPWQQIYERAVERATARGALFGD